MKTMVDEKGKKEAGGGGKAVEPAKPRPSVLEFLAQVRQEVSKVTWPTRQETTVSTIAVFVMLALAAVFFMIVDMILGWTITAIMNLV
jgi:preprotein translocase subunit SecE